MTQRKPISKKLRFEVFKRDAFTCQYCGGKAPETILHVDHIEPVSKGGNNDILNLITSCQACNAGKSDRRLDEQSTLAAQRRQLEDLNVRREQLEMMLRWREAVESIADDEVDAICSVIDQALIRFNNSLNDTGRSQVATWVKKYGIEHVLNSVDVAAKQYLPESADENGWDHHRINRFIDQIPRIAYWQSRGGMPEIKQRIYYVRGILNKRLSYVNQRIAVSLVQEAIDAGVDIDWITEMAKDARSWTQFREWLDSAINEAHNGTD